MAANEPRQDARGSYIAQAQGEGASASVVIAQRLQLSDEQFATVQALITQQLYRPPTFEELFETLRDPALVTAAVQRSTRSPLVPSIPDYIAKRQTGDDTQVSLRTALVQSRSILVLAPAGLGKTRETGELASALAAEGWTVCVATSADFRMAPLGGRPALLETGNVLLVIDDLEQRMVPGSPHDEPYADRLLALLAYLDRVLLPTQLHVIATARTEPHVRLDRHVPADHPFWRRFAPFNLAHFNDTDLVRLLVVLSAGSGIAVAADEATQLVARSDRTPRTLVQNVRRASADGSRNDLASYWQGSQFGSTVSLLAAVEHAHPEVAVAIGLLLRLRADGIPLRRRYATALGAATGVAPFDAAIDVLIDAGLAGERDGELTLFEDTSLEERAAPALSDGLWERLVQFIIEVDTPTAFFGLLRRLWIDARYEALQRIADILIARSDALVADGHFYAGMLALVRAEPSRAESELSTAIKLSFDEADAYLHRAVARSRLGRFAEAIEDVDAALVRERDDAFVYVMKGLIELELGRAEAAEHDFGLALARGGDRRIVYTNRGIARLAQKKYAPAEEDLIAALEAGRSDFPVFLNRGIARASMGRLAGADEDFTVALGLSPGNPQTLRWRGAVRRALKHYSEAITDLTHVVSLEPGAEDYYERALARIGVGDAPGAESDLDQAIAMQRTDPESYAERGALRGARGDHVGAELDFSAAIELGDERPLTRTNRAWARFEVSDLDGAAADLDLLVDLEPSIALPYYRRGLVRFEQQRYSEADADLTVARALSNGDDVEICRARGIVRLQLELFDQAEQDIQAAIDRTTASAELRRLRGVARLQQDRNAEAEADFSAALEMGGPPALLHRYRGVARIKRGAWFAERDLKKAAALGPSAWEGSFDLAASLVRRKRWNEALTRLQALNAPPDATGVQVLMAVCRHHLGEHAAAAVDLAATPAQVASNAALFQPLFYVRLFRRFRGIREPAGRPMREAAAVWAEVLNITSQYPNDLRMQLELAQAASLMIMCYAARGNTAAMREPLDALETIAKRRPAEEELLAQVATGAASAITAYGLAQSWANIERAAGVLHLVHGRLSTSLVDRQVALGLFNLTTMLGRNGRLEEAHVAVRQVEQLFDAHPGDERLAVYYARSLKNVLLYLGSAGDWLGMQESFAGLRALAASVPDSMPIQELLADATFNATVTYAAHGRRDDLVVAGNELLAIGSRFRESASIQLQVGKAAHNAIGRHITLGDRRHIEPFRMMLQQMAMTFVHDSDIQVLWAQTAALLLPFYQRNGDAAARSSVTEALRAAHTALSTYAALHPSDTATQALSIQQDVLQSWPPLAVT